MQWCCGWDISGAMPVKWVRNHENKKVVQVYNGGGLNCDVIIQWLNDIGIGLRTKYDLVSAIAYVAIFIDTFR